MEVSRVRSYEIYYLVNLHPSLTLELIVESFRKNGEIYYFIGQEREAGSILLPRKR